ncbi:MAG: protein kinase [Micrococcales bacterium]|nr:protein kinase [Micrococcales bacterium]MCL2668917.1 protein kinase [Micrococcales bacterium]
MLAGDVLSQWLQGCAGTTVRGSLVTQSRGGLPRTSPVPNSRPVQVLLPVVHGGQAAVARALHQDRPDVPLALRVQAISSGEERSRQMERLLNMLAVATAARERPERYPAVLPVLESFVMSLPGAQIHTTAPAVEHELWCDVMAWCPQDLTGWRTAAPRPPSVVLTAFLPVLGTVAAVHDDLGVIHRDITPNNVLVDTAGRLRLGDWGIAHTLDADRTSTHTQLVGNRGFSLPPEMLAGDTSVGRYTDAWYLGSLLSWMLTGQPPGPQHGETWLPPGIPDDPAGQQVRAVLQGLCWPDLRNRTALPEAFARLSDVAAGRTSQVTARTVSMPQTSTPITQAPVAGTGSVTGTAVVGVPPARQSRAPVAIVVGAVAVLLVVLGVVVWTANLFGSTGDPRTASGAFTPTPDPSEPEPPACWINLDTGACPPYAAEDAALETFYYAESSGMDVPACDSRYESIMPSTYYYLLCGWPEDQAACPRSQYECGKVRLRYFDDMATMRAYFVQQHGYRESPDIDMLPSGTLRDVAGTVYTLDDGLSSVAYCYDEIPFCLDVQSRDRATAEAIAARFLTADQSDVDQLAAYLRANPPS